jgi:hypothetical protein
MTVKKQQQVIVPWSPLKILSIIGAVGLALAAFPAFWTFSDHWMNRAEIESAQKKTADEAKKTSDTVLAELKSHKQSDVGIQAWMQYGLASNRTEFLDDHQAECEAKRMMNTKLAPVDAAMCARWEAKLKTKMQEAADLKAKAMDATKEK